VRVLVPRDVVGFGVEGLGFRLGESSCSTRRCPRTALTMRLLLIPSLLVPEKKNARGSSQNRPTIEAKET
jgi:hypothetical protein